MNKALLTWGFFILALTLFFFLLTPSAAITMPPDARPTPTVQPPGPQVPPGSHPADYSGYPDLIVESISTEPITPTANLTATVKVVIRNAGLVDVPYPKNFFVDLYVNPAILPIPLLPGDLAWGAQYWWVPAGQSWELTATYRFTNTHTYVLYAQVDTDNSVAEANEDNNVSGPVQVTVESTGRFRQSTHQEFQYGLASGLDLSPPAGVLRLGYFEEPWADAGVTVTSVYTPDAMINDATGTISNGILLTTTVTQIRPSLVMDEADNPYAVWQDARHGGTYNNRIYFAASTNQGITWSDSISLTANIPITRSVDQLAPRLAYDQGNGNLYAVWQDNRNGNYDIYFTSSANQGITWTNSLKLNKDLGTAHQMNPSLVVSDGGHIYVAWQDQRNGNDDIYFTRSHDGGVNWAGSNTFVTDDSLSSSQAQRSPNIGVGWFGFIYVAWEDWRSPGHPDIYVAKSVDDGDSFGVDVPVDVDSMGKTYRVAPSMVVSATTDANSGARLDVVHLAWQEGQGDNADVYYAWSWYSYDPIQLPNEPTSTWGYTFFFRPRIRINGYVMDSQYAFPPEGKTVWPIEPSWQGEVALTKAWSLDPLHCGDADTWYIEGVYIAWSDGRSFDVGRRDIFVARVGHPAGDQYDVRPEFLVCNNNEALNSNAKLYAFRDNVNLYRQYGPANVRQANPSIVASSAGAVYLAWDDDRWDTPLTPGTRRNRDVFFARKRGDAASGVYISPVFDTISPVTTWYTLDWWGATDYRTPIYFQTRTGNTPQPPKSGAAEDGWSAWAGPGPYLFAGVKVYDAPGQDIVSPSGRYIQYKLIIDGNSRRTALSQVTIHYEDKVSRVYLPLVLRSYGP